MAVGSIAGSLDFNDFSSSNVFGSSNTTGGSIGPTLELYSIAPSITEKPFSSLCTGTEEEQVVEEEVVEQIPQTQNDDDFFSDSSTSPFFSSLATSTQHQQNTEEEEKKKKEALKRSPKLLAQIQVPDRFNRLSWGTPGTTGDSLGIIAGGQVDGTISLFDANKMVELYSKNKKKASPHDEALVASLDKHQNSVRGLEFNPKQLNLLASAGDDGQLYIWNLKQPEQPAAVVLGCKNPHQNQTISHLQWNRKYEYILATTSHQGTSVVWDLKQKRVLVPFSNTAHPRSRYSSLAWNPDVHTQLLVACEDDERPVIEVWDLRKAYAPIRELGTNKQGHQRGVLSVSWCNEDSNLLVSTGKDNRTLIWNPNTGDMLGEVSTGFSQTIVSGNKGRISSSDDNYNWVFDAQWSHRSTILSTCSFDKKIQVYSVQDASSIASESSDEMAETVKKSNQNNNQPSAKTLKTAPKWLKRPTGVSWCFGNRLIAFSNTPKQESEEQSLEQHQQVQQFMQPNPIAIYSGASALATSLDESDAPKLAQFNKQVVGLEGIVLSQAGPQERRDVALAFCQQKQEEVKDSESLSFEWKLMEILFTPEEEKGKKIQALLGYDRTKIEEMSQGVKDKKTPVEVERNTSEDLSLLIKQNLIVGNIQGAVKCFVEANRFSEALVLAKVNGSTELWNYVMEEFLSSAEGSTLNSLKDIMYKNYDAIVTSDEAETGLENWKEKLAILCGDMSKNKLLIDKILKLLIEREEQRLTNQAEETADDRFGSLLSSYLAGQIEQTFTRWIAEFEKTVESLSNTTPSYALELIDLLSKIELLHLHHVTSAAISKRPTTISYIESILNQMLQNGHVLNQYYLSFALKCIEFGSMVDVQKALPLALRYMSVALDQVASQHTDVILPKEYSNVDIHELRYRLFHSISKPIPGLKSPSIPPSWIKKKEQPKPAPTAVVPPQRQTHIPTSTSPSTGFSTQPIRSDSPPKRGYKKDDVQLRPQPLPTYSPISNQQVPATGTVIKPSIPLSVPSHGGMGMVPRGGMEGMGMQPMGGQMGGQPMTFNAPQVSNTTATFAPQQPMVATFTAPPMVNTTGASFNAPQVNTTASFSPSVSSNTFGSSPSWQPVTDLPPMEHRPVQPLPSSSAQPIQPVQPVVDQQAIDRQNIEKYAGIDINRSIVSDRNQTVIEGLTRCFDKLYGGEDKGLPFLDKKRMIAQSVDALFVLLQETTNDQLVGELNTWVESMLNSDFTNADHIFKSLQKHYFQELKNAKNMRFLMTSLKTAKQ